METLTALFFVPSGIPGRSFRPTPDLQVSLMIGSQISESAKQCINPESLSRGTVHSDQRMFVPSHNSALSLRRTSLLRRPSVPVHGIFEPKETQRQQQQRTKAAEQSSINTKAHRLQSSALATSSVIIDAMPQAMSRAQASAIDFCRKVDKTNPHR